LGDDGYSKPTRTIWFDLVCGFMTKYPAGRVTARLHHWPHFDNENGRPSEPVRQGFEEGSTAPIANTVRYAKLAPARLASVRVR
jgi:hypothetical protein